MTEKIEPTEEMSDEALSLAHKVCAALFEGANVVDWAQDKYAKEIGVTLVGLIRMVVNDERRLQENKPGEDAGTA